MDTAPQFGRTLTARLDLGAPRDGDMPEGLAVYAVGNYRARSARAAATTSSRVDNVGLTGGVEYGFGTGWSAGRQPPAQGQFRQCGAPTWNRSRSRSASMAASGIAGGFVQGYLGLAGTATTSTASAWSRRGRPSPRAIMVAGAKAGYLTAVGALRIGPVVGLDHARVRSTAIPRTAIRR